MAKTSDYKRGYSNGYNAGKTSADKRLAAVYDEQKRLAERVERAEKEQGLGHCEDCAHWKRGCDTCAWGRCEATKVRHAGTPWGTWIHGEETSCKEVRVMTAMRFGCVLFTAKNSGPTPGNDQK